MTRTERDLTVAARQLSAALESVDDKDLDTLAQILATAGRVVLYSGGREGLALRGWTMRLFHAGVQASYVGDVTCPPVGDGDVVVLSSGPGTGEITRAVLELAHRHGAKVVLVTAAPTSDLAREADVVMVIRAQTMADDRGSAEILPMGSAYEIALLTVGDLIVNRVRDLRGETASTLRLRHANLE